MLSNLPKATQLVSYRVGTPESVSIYYLFPHDPQGPLFPNTSVQNVTTGRKQENFQHLETWEVAYLCPPGHWHMVTHILWFPQTWPVSLLSPRKELFGIYREAPNTPVLRKKHPAVWLLCLCDLLYIRSGVSDLFPFLFLITSLFELFQGQELKLESSRPNKQTQKEKLGSACCRDLWSYPPISIPRECLPLIFFHTFLMVLMHFCNSCKIEASLWFPCTHTVHQRETQKRKRTQKLLPVVSQAAISLQGGDLTW